MGLDHFLCFLRREVRILHLFLLTMLSFCCNAPPKQAMLAKITKFELVQYLIIRWIHENLIIKETEKPLEVANRLKISSLLLHSK